MRGLRQTLGGLWLMALASVAMAAGIEGLYEAELHVASQAEEERQTALRVGLGRVLTRVSGQQYLLDPELREALAAPQRFVQQFRYSRDEGEEGLSLWVRYDETSIDALLERSGLTVWGRIRPRTLVWFAVDDGDERVLLDGDSDHPVRKRLDELARQWGVPLQWPLMDLRDSRRVRISDVWGAIKTPVLRASRRYAPQAILMGRVAPLAEGGWEARWRLMGLGKDRSWVSRGALLEEAITPGVQQTFVGLAATYAGVEQEAGRVRLDIDGIASLRDYAAIRDYLAGLSEVQGLRVKKLAAGRLTLELELRSGVQGLVQTVALSGTLVPANEGMDVADQAVPGQGLQELEYRYLP